MRPKSIVLLALALGCGLVASIGISQYMKAKPEENNAPEVDRSMVVVVAQEVPKGGRVEQEMLTLKKWPAEVVPQGAISDPEQVLGRVARQRLFPGELIMDVKLAEEGKILDFPKGMRLVTIKVDYWSVISGFVQPDDRVDVVMIYNGQNTSTTIGKNIIENVVVWAVDQEVERELEKPNAMALKGVTLLVTPDQAVKLKLAEQKGPLSLSLRSFDDHETGQTESWVYDDLLREPSEAGPKSDDPAQDFRDMIGSYLDGGDETVPPGPKWTMKIMVGNFIKETKEYHLRLADN